MNRITTIITRAAVAAAAALAIGGSALPASAATHQAPHYYADDVAGHRFGPAITGTAQQMITTATARYHRDPAEFVQTARFAHYQLPGGVSWLIGHPDAWSRAATGFGSYLRSTIREEVRWTDAYRTEYAIPHGRQAPTFGWTSMPSEASTVEVFTWGDLRANCGFQMYVPVHKIPLPSRPRPVSCKKGAHGKGKTCTAPCPSGERLFMVAGARYCLCLQTVHVIISQTRTVTVQIITTETTTTSTTTVSSYGKCTKRCRHSVK